jgi:hypothetical protein
MTTSDQVKAYKEEADKWDKKDKDAQVTITQTLPKTLKIKVIDCTMAAGMWAILTKRFTQVNFMTKAKYIKKMFMIKCPEDGDPCDTLNDLELLRKQHASMGGSMEDQIYASIILMAMPERYQQLLLSFLSGKEAAGLEPTTNDIAKAVRLLAQDCYEYSSLYYFIYDFSIFFQFFSEFSYIFRALLEIT